MATRVVEWKKPYTWGKAISIDENKVISLNLRDENNLIIYDEWDDEIYVDLQLDDEITPTSAFPIWVNVGRVIVDNWWDKPWTIISAETTSGDNIKIFYADEWTLWIDNGTGTFKQIYFKADVDALLLALRQYIDEQLALKQDVLTAGDNISIVNNVISAEIPAMAKFLSVWDSSLWEPTTQPWTLPYEYYTWDYYLVENVDSTTNYRPDWTEYDGTASSVVETNPIADWDTYIYDWTNWILQSNTQPTVSFSQIVWQPTDNTNLATALSAKQDTLVSWTNIKTVNSTSLLWTGDVTVQETLVSWTNIKTINNTSLLGSGDITISAPTYTAWSHIDITSNVISTKGLQEELTAGDNINIWPKIESDMKWPCPSGFHVPLNTEWQAVKDIWTTLWGWSSDWTNFWIALKLPFAGQRSYYSADVDNQGSGAGYWSSTSSGMNRAYAIEFNPSRIYRKNNYISRSYGFSVRCFKNSPTVPTSSWTKLYWTSIESWWIFWSSTDWLISISSDWQTWITIADKNLWATTVWNSWDTLSEANCGKYYQRWNNYGFPRTWSVTTSSTQVDASNYWPWNYYSSDTFIKDGWGWDSGDNWNLWWWVTQWTFQDGEKISAINTTQADVDSTAPSNPSEWDLWYDTTNSAMKVWDWTAWQSVGWWDVLVSDQPNNILTSWMKIWAWLESDYWNLGTYDSNCLYLVIE